MDWSSDIRCYDAASYRAQTPHDDPLLRDWRREWHVLFREIERLPLWLAIADELCRLALIAMQREQVIAIAFHPSRGCPGALIRKIWARANAINRFAVDHEQMRDLPTPAFETDHGNVFAVEP